MRLSMIKAVLLSSLLAVTVAFCGNQTSLSFPELEPVGGIPVGYTWKLENGPDFYIYRASTAKISDTQLAIYFGTAPQFIPSATATGHAGTVSGHAVVWEHSVDNGVQQSDTVFPYRHSSAHEELKIHAWVRAPETESREALEKSLPSVSLRLRKTGPA